MRLLSQPGAKSRFFGCAAYNLVARPLRYSGSLRPYSTINFSETTTAKIKS